MSGFYDYNDDIDIDSSSSSEDEQTYNSNEEDNSHTPQPIASASSTSTSPQKPKVTLRVPPQIPQPTPTSEPDPEPDTYLEQVEPEPEADDEPEDDSFAQPAYSSRAPPKRKKKTLFFSPAYNVVGSTKSKRGGAAAKIPRAVKLKPLKDVLSRLITQIKKKDDYAFFLHPVDLSEVPGYTDIIKRPMDFGTMSNKVAKGRYRSLEEFTDDFQLVTSNAKLFNPPGTIHHTEASRIESWGTEQIQKAATTVIQYEADWNIDVEQDNPDQAEDAEDAEPDTPGDRGRSTSVLSSVPGQGAPRRRTAVAGSSSKKELTLSESLEPDGRMPGAKQGLGAFPPGSDFAETMLRLKVQKRRHITKKERLRIEKVGRPYMADGSLEYAVMEDPFSVLSPFLPEKPAKPRLTPIFPPPSNATLIPTTHLYDNLNLPKPTKMKHWSISRPTKKPKDPEPVEQAEPPDLSREPIALDYGSLAELVAHLEDEIRRLGAIQPPKSKPIEDTGEYWNRKRAVESEKYLSTVVYGGMLGVGYTRSVAEFLKRPPELSTAVKNPALGVPLPHWVERNVIDPLTCTNHLWLRSAAANLQLSSPTSKSLSNSVATSLHRSMHTYPAIEMIKKARSCPIELGVLVKKEARDELEAAEDEWVGRLIKEEEEDKKDVQKREEEEEEEGTRWMSMRMVILTPRKRRKEKERYHNQQQSQQQRRQRHP